MIWAKSRQPANRAVTCRTTAEGATADALGHAILLAVVAAPSRAAVLAAACEQARDVSMAATYVRHELASMAATDAAEVIGAAREGAEAGSPRARLLLSVIGLALAPVGSEALRQSLARAASERGDVGTAAMLAPVPTAEPTNEVPPVPDFGVGRPLTLGERKSLARRRDRNLLARVLRDPHPDVIRVLLGNPSITEPDIVRLCARRPIAPDVLREVAASARWIVRYDVRLALAKNPHTPLEVSVPAALQLRAQDQRVIATSDELPQTLRDACARAVVGAVRTLH